ncbi:MAG TPA: hypothetical protein VJX68_06570 [Candidatus Binatus sp.]|uniref:hypothetical protein n=1 Tax=Candidatus Binatus sp. TaxID=2811406 RepID=UPI002B480293|nr:hypothetical protein [Candidatus Binatus sp.]HKN12845.1 hypothetical protein [Candidatus Binatus sp.]
MPDGPARVSLWRYSPALVLFAIAIADIRQLSDPDLWGHILWGRELLAHGSLPANNVYSYTAPGYHWLRHEWLSQILMSSIFDRFGPFGLKLFKFLCTAATISFIVLAESETAAPAGVQALITLVAALILVPSIQFRPHLFDLLSLSAIIYLLARRNRRGSAPLWIVIPIMAIWSNLHGGFFIGLVAMGVYGAATILEDTYMGRGQRRGLVILAITAAAAASTLCTLLIPPARDTWYTLIYALLDPTTRSNIVDWKPLVASLTTAPAGSLEQKYFATVLLFFAAAIISVILRPKGKDAPLVAVATVLLAAGFAAQRNIAIATIAVVPVFANHLGLLLRPREAATAERVRPTPPAGKWIAELLIALVAIGFARYSGILKPGIDASGNPADAVNFMNRHGLAGNVLADYVWGEFVIWHGGPGTKVFIDSRYDLGYPPQVIADFLELDRGKPDAAHTLAAYPTDFVLTRPNYPEAKVMDSQPDWRLIYSDDVARLYARANSPAAHLDGVPFKGTARPTFFP